MEDTMQSIPTSSLDPAVEPTEGCTRPIPKTIDQDQSRMKPEKTRRGKRRTKAQKNALRRQVEGVSGKVKDSKSTVTDNSIDTIKASTRKDTPKDLDSFPLFPKLPAELRLKIIQFAANARRHISLHVKDGMRAKWLPFCENDYSILQVNHEMREEVLKIFQNRADHENWPSPYRDPEYSFLHPTELLSNPLLCVDYDSDLVTLDKHAASLAREKYRDLFLSMHETSFVRRLVLPIPEGLEGRIFRIYTYAWDLLHDLPWIKELCFLYDGPLGSYSKVHKCSYPSLVGNPTVLVDITDDWPADQIEKFAPEFTNVQRHITDYQTVNAKKGGVYASWKLERIRLVIWAKNRRHKGKGMNVGRVANINGDGIYMRVGEKTLPPKE